VDPEFIVCDEPISALDVSIQAQVINMLKQLQEELGLTYLFIAHDLSVVKYISDRVIVMYLGSIVEEAPSDELYLNPVHPYTKALLSSIPIADPIKTRQNQRIIIKGEVSSPINPKECCLFADRCPYATKRCYEEKPQKKEVGPGHTACCHLL
jgi:oligopeptide transport system ATP-binding protein